MYRTRYNQYEAIVEPLVEWLQRQGVNFLTGAFVQRIAFAPSPGRITASAMEYVRDGEATVVEIESGDVVLVTNGSQTTDLSVGSMMAPPNPRYEGRSWALWKILPMVGPISAIPRFSSASSTCPIRCG